MYRACMDEETIENLGFEPFAPILDNYPLIFDFDENAFIWEETVAQNNKY